MRRTLLIARNEYVTYVTRRGFLIGVVLFPLWIGLVVALPGLLASTTPVRHFAVVDRAGGYAEAVADGLVRDEARRILHALAAFAEARADLEAVRHDAPRVAALLAAPERRASLDAFVGMGGWRPAFAALRPHLKPGSVFDPPGPRFILVPTPADIVQAGAGFAEHVSAYFTGNRELAGGRTLFAVLVVPEGFGSADTPAQYWSTNLADGALQGFLRSALTDALRLKAARATAPDVDVAGLLRMSADIEHRDPTRGGGDADESAQAVATFLPFALAFLLFFATFINANALLMGVIEEKSSRMIEVLLSCASPAEIMVGKLMGVMAAAMTTILLWAGGLLGAVGLFAPDFAATVLSALASFATLDIAPLVILYFLCGLLIYGSIFLAIGSMASSIADAQALLGPVVLIIILPNLMMSVVMRDPNGIVATVVSWIPIYTPFFMLFRIGSHPPVLEVWGTAILSLAAAAFLVSRMGRVFARNVLTTERPPAFSALLRRVFAVRSRVR